MPKKKDIIPHTIEVPLFADDRGYFSPVLDGPDRPIKRIYYVVNPVRGVVRGFHFHKKEWKYFVIVKGSAKFIAINPDNPKEMYQFTSGERKPLLVVIPPGYANGWVSLEDNTILLCGSSSTTKESLKDDHRYDPYTWGDLWQTKHR
ncbi:MAG: hypothetical protein COU90_01980 [Candidatus Ryanbacteria bacterium CG10_big_fil_rev_8_21_14_0_10_43_42]|uniref:Sugar 3,4-ketoisomerase QdtA cupin domain-containing protein n=1 Tax=Candidatus Ryanbacteria bacterium CG10_big_fil_rev_8_21_14_0_10_43_42 TaxID=1974864 RepID=A0A2M8KXC7_9BACT|nr:MAG: hypothetical protein COU90_01980 [Candidatus Ryanbacteria bacterium CG10_big_fil_rev_8_21_14_0_10_43_42]